MSRRQTARLAGVRPSAHVACKRGADAPAVTSVQGHLAPRSVLTHTLPPCAVVEGAAAHVGRCPAESSL